MISDAMWVYAKDVQVLGYGTLKVLPFSFNIYLT
jgi:hypothetical protein